MAGAVLRCAGSARIWAAGNLRKLAHDLVAQMIVGQDPEALGRDQRPQPVHGRLDQRALAHDVQHLFGNALAAARPEARAAASGQDQSVIVRSCRGYWIG